MCPKKSSKQPSKKRQKIAQKIISQLIVIQSFLAQIHAVPHVNLISRNSACPILLNLKRIKILMLFQIGFETIVSLQEHVFSTIMQFCISFRPFSYTYKFCDTQARHVWHKLTYIPQDSKIFISNIQTEKTGKYLKKN